MSAFNRFGERAAMRNALDTLEWLVPNEIDRKLLGPDGEAFTRDALNDYFRWAPDKFVDPILASLTKHSLVLWELVYEVAHSHGFRSHLPGCYQRVEPWDYGTIRDVNPGLRCSLRSEGESVVIQPSDNRYIRRSAA